MGRGVGDDLRPELLGNESRQALCEAHADASDSLGAQPDRGGQHQVDPIRLQQIDRADVGIEATLDQVYEVVESLCRIAAV